MRNYIYVVNKVEQKKNYDTCALINTVKDADHTFKNYITKEVECYFYTNEDIRYVEKSNEYFFGFSGQLANSAEYIKKGIETAIIGKERKFISSIAGANSISFYHIPTKRLEAYNSFSGVNPVYYCENENRIVIGVDPLVVNCVAYDSKKPIFDLSNISSFLMMGYYFSHDTLFKNVKTIPYNSVVSVVNQTLHVDKIDDSVDEMFTQPAKKQTYEEITDAFLKSLDVIPKTERKFTVGLTGGKDSRLIALGLKEKNITFDAITRGDEDHPDVKVAKLLANKMNLNHTVKEPVSKKSKEITVNLYDKILKTMLGSNGMLYGYENINYMTTYKGNMGITGVGAEAIRGGFGITRNKEVDNITEFLLSSYYPFKELILPKYRDNYQNELTIIGDKSTSLRETGNKLFIEFYNGKRTASARAALSYYSNSLSPFFDSNFLKKVTKIDIDEISTEKFYFNLMNNLNSEIAMLPFANDRWSFERLGPLNPNDLNGWLERNPILAKTQRGNYNWRLFRNGDMKFKEAFKSMLLDTPDSEIFQVVDYEKIKNIFKSNSLGKYNRVLWSLLSIKIYMNYFNNKNDYSNQLYLDIPSSNDVTISQPNIYNITNYIQPLNDKLLINKNEHNTISINQESEKFGYLVIGDGNLITPSSDKFQESFTIEKSKKLITVRFCLEILAENTELSFFIMFFDENKKRFSSKEYKQKVNLGINYFYKSLKIDYKAKFVKFAIKINSSTNKPVLNIKYGYIKYS